MGLGRALRESTTLKFVTPAYLAVLVRYSLGGLETPMGEIPVTTATEFGMAIAAILAIWLGREWKEAHYRD